MILSYPAKYDCEFFPDVGYSLQGALAKYSPNGSGVMDNNDNDNNKIEIAPYIQQIRRFTRVSEECNNKNQLD